MVHTRRAAQWVRMLALTAVGLLLSPEARADHVTLRNGDSLTGAVASVSKADLVVDTELAGRVTLTWSAVTRLASAASVRARLPAERTVEGALVMIEGRLSIQTSDSSTVLIDLATVRALEIATPAADRASWHAALNAGWDLSRGNATTSTISTNGTATRLGPHDKLGLFGSYLFSAVGSGTDSETTARSSRGGARYDHDVLGRAFGFGFVDIQNDPFQLLDLRTVGGGGAGLHVAKTERSQLNLVAGISFSRDAYIQTTTTTTGGTSTTTPPGQGGTPPGQGGTPPGKARRSGTPPSVVRTSLTRTVGEFLFGQDLTHQLSNTISVTEGLTYFTAVTDWQDYRVSFDLSLSAQLNSWLQWNLTIADRYLNIPPAGGAVQNDTFVSTGLGVTLGSGGASYTGADARPPASKR